MSKQKVDGLMIEHLLHALATMKITKKKQEMRKI
jgi:hypothetical protein